MREAGPLLGTLNAASHLNPDLSSTRFRPLDSSNFRTHVTGTLRKSPQKGDTSTGVGGSETPERRPDRRRVKELVGNSISPSPFPCGRWPQLPLLASPGQSQRAEPCYFPTQGPRPTSVRQSPGSLTRHVRPLTLLGLPPTPLTLLSRLHVSCQASRDIPLVTYTPAPPLCGDTEPSRSTRRYQPRPCQSRTLLWQDPRPAQGAAPRLPPAPCPLPFDRDSPRFV